MGGIFGTIAKEECIADLFYGKKDGAYAATSETNSFPNLGYEVERYAGHGEIIRMRADGLEQMRKPNEEMQICSPLYLLWIPCILL